MDYSLTFARHFSRLVWLLLNDAASVDQQKGALRALVTVGKDGPVTLSTQGMRLLANGALCPEALQGVPEVAAQLIGHAVRELKVEQAAAPGDLLGAARLLAAEPVPGDQGQAFASKLAALGAKTVAVSVGGSVGVGFADLEMEVLSAEESEDASAAASAMAADLGAATATAAANAARTAAAAAAAAKGGGAAAAAAVAAPSTSSGAFLDFAAPAPPRERLADLFSELDAATSPAIVSRLLDELVTAAEQAARSGDIEKVADALGGVVKREPKTQDGPLRGAYGMAARRLFKPTLLRPVAQMVATRPARADDYVATLARAGEDGADALIEQLTNASSLGERRAYFDALVRLNAGVSALVHMLGDARWYVVRNAADLLGEMKATEADVPLGELLKHDDERVRRAAVSALGKLGTAKSATTLQHALRDSAPGVRTQAAAGLAAHAAGGNAAAGKTATAALGDAFDAELDGEVQLALLAALGRVGTADAVQRLMKVAEPEGRLFKKKAPALRVAAVHGLGEARTPAALNALSELLTDKEKEVRDAAVRVFRSAAQPKN
ncbi:MAG TPA: HEAT repeat domain-containing protein [Gemmatimonadaceae bacterium]|nr:HEAT repeat domain-containing protein [Gemmatimonadaceae bacterium]